MLLVIALIQSLTVAVSGPPTSPEYLPLRVAAAEGYFAQEGLAVRLETTRAESGAAEALAQGQVDLAATSLDAIMRFGRRAGLPAPRLLLGLTAAPPVALLAPASQTSVVKSVEDLPSTRVGIVTPGAPEHAWLGWLLARSGLSLAQLWIVSYGAHGLMHAIETGDVHAALVPEPSASQLLDGGEARLLADFRTPGAVLQTLGVVTVNAGVFSRGDRRLSPPDIAAFTRAVLAAERRLATAEPAALAERLPARVVASAEDFGARVAVSRMLYLTDGRVTVESLEETLALLRAHHPLPANVPPLRAEELLRPAAGARRPVRAPR